MYTDILGRRYVTIVEAEGHSQPRPVRELGSSTSTIYDTLLKALTATRQAEYHDSLHVSHIFDKVLKRT